MKESLTISASFPVPPSVVYNAWLSSKEHSAMTGGTAISSNAEGDPFSAWDGYITGTNVTLKRNERIVQRWRTSEFAEDDEDSLLTVLLKAVDNGCEMTLIHTDIPEGQTQYEQGWADHYITPMKSYFNKKGSLPR